MTVTHTAGDRHCLNHVQTMSFKTVFRRSISNITLVNSHSNGIFHENTPFYILLLFCVRRLLKVFVGQRTTTIYLKNQDFRISLSAAQRERVSVPVQRKRDWRLTFKCTVCIK